MKRIFPDANILFSAVHNGGGKSAFIIELAAAGEWKIFTSAFTAEEARRNLDLKYPEKIVSLENLIDKMIVVAESFGRPFPAGLIEKERPVFQAALSWNATYLITGDMLHFGSYMQKPAEQLWNYSYDAGAVFGLTINSCCLPSLNGFLT